ncbi:MAG: biotin--[acetyl-CoA-carboxylase] ligase [Alphaproteobacteria bacterium]|nr:biotin--[acetyl-CoA-carboxylase] ligase [Alphaproteobacteria bacterium]MBL0718019.1 biotin--[acetyl-CoA-carboxylase] ligase [Alphaproteobacteria bacterium]
MFSYKTENDNLPKYIRRKLDKKGVKDTAGFKILKFRVVNSTQTVAKKIVDNRVIQNNVAVQSSIQTNGVGQFQRKWKGKSGNLFVSTIHKIPRSLDSVISVAVSVAVLKTIKVFDVSSVKLKWPNDVLVNMKKISGTLIERVGDYLIIGTGINVKNYPKKLAYKATSMKAENNSKKNITLDTVFLEYLKQLDEVIKFAQIDAKKITDEWNSSNAYKGRFVQVYSAYDKTYKEGINLGIDDKSRLLLSHKDEKITCISGNIITNYVGYDGNKIN